MALIQTIQNRIYEIRGERVMIDKDLAELYEVETRVLNQAVKRNLKRFPTDFMFQLTHQEWDNLRYQIDGIENTAPSKSQIVTLNTAHGKHLKYLPHVFTEQGVAMLSSVLNSDKSISMNIAIMRVFVEIRKTLLVQNDIREQIKLIRERLGEHDTQLSHIYDAMENLLDEKAAQKKWGERDRIGFKSQL
ncbi:ORF6N domain-containing protein [Paraflavitalea soli]|uniref:ORF6N domain-containing protein n=1 Tax=Paraflavitalea soli TaxID=2315862 RepID=A0A3B7MI85_9BACT|nr:ORF6N domain-containing protein [Paraflavitalea soli]AXY72890.1 ORF6N domain-containing protein [Paraflavitalea soli]